MAKESAPIKVPESLCGPENPWELSPDESRVVDMIANSFNPGEWWGGSWGWQGDDKTKKKKKRINQKLWSTMDAIASSLG